MAPAEQTPKDSKQQPTFKEQLDQAAHDAQHAGDKNEEPSIVEKGIEKGEF